MTQKKRNSNNKRIKIYFMKHRSMKMYGTVTSGGIAPRIFTSSFRGASDPLWVYLPYR
jgi:hypothetical protein